MSEGNISAMAMLSHLRLIETRIGADRYAELRAQLSKEERTTIDELTAVGWVPISLSARVMWLGAELSGREAISFHDEIVGDVIEQNFKTVWRILMRFTSDAALVARASTLVHKVFDRGEVVAQMLSPGHGLMMISAWPDMPERAFVGVRAAVQRVLELSGRSDVKVKGQRVAEGARYDITWRL